MPDKKPAEKTPEEHSETMDSHVLAAQEDPSLIVVGDANDGGFKQEPGHGWSDEEVALRAWDGNGPRPDAAAPAVAMDTGVKSTKK